MQWLAHRVLPILVSVFSNYFHPHPLCDFLMTLKQSITLRLLSKYVLQNEAKSTHSVASLRPPDSASLHVLCVLMSYVLWPHALFEIGSCQYLDWSRGTQGNTTFSLDLMLVFSCSPLLPSQTSCYRILEKLPPYGRFFSRPTPIGGREIHIGWIREEEEGGTRRDEEEGPLAFYLRGLTPD